MINLRFATQDHKDHFDYRVTDDLITDGMSQRTWWEIVLGVKCQVAVRVGMRGDELWTIWLRYADWSYAMERFECSRYSEENVEFVVADDRMTIAQEEPIMRDILEWRLAYCPDDCNVIFDRYELFARDSLSPPGKIVREGGWEHVATTVGDSNWDKAFDMVFDEGKDTMVRFYLNGIYRSTDYTIWVYTSEDGYVPRSFTARGAIR